MDMIARVPTQAGLRVSSASWFSSCRIHAPKGKILVGMVDARNTLGASCSPSGAALYCYCLGGGQGFREIVDPTWSRATLRCGYHDRLNDG
jgi:hypothetical protein